MAGLEDKLRELSQSAVSNLPGVDLANRITSQFTDSEVGELVRRGQITDPNTAVRMMQSGRADTPQDMHDALQNAQPDTQALQRNAAPPPSDFLTQRDDTISQAQSDLADRRAEYDAALQAQAEGLNSEDPALEAARSNYISKSNQAINSIAGINNEAQSAYDDALTKYNSAVKDADDFVKNKKSFWENKSDGQKAMAIIAMAIGGFVEGYSMGKIRNNAADIIENKIQTYIKEQELQYDKLKDKAGAAQNLYGMLRNKYGDKLVAQKAMLDVGLDQAAKMVDTLGASAKKKENIEALQSQIAEKRTKIAEDVAAATEKQTLSQGQLAKMGQDTRFIPPQDEKERQGFINGFGTATGGREQAKEIFKETISPARKALNSIDRLVELADSNRLNTWITGATQGELDSLVVGLRAGAAPEVIGTGTRSESDKADLVSFIANPADWSKIFSKASNVSKLKSIARNILDNSEDTIVNYGGMKLSPEFEKWKQKYGTYSFNPNGGDKFSQYGKKGKVRPGY